MRGGRYRFGTFLLDMGNRRLTRGGDEVAVNGRYLDALALLVGARGALVSKDRFMDEVWRGVPVTDEALTQCIRTLRRQLGDDAASPRFIQTVPKYGYRFVMAVDEAVEIGPVPSPATAPLPEPPEGPGATRLHLALGGTLGGAAAGLAGGFFYGFAGASQPADAAAGMGAASVLLVMLAVTLAVAVLGAAGVALGIAAAGLDPDAGPIGPVIGGAAGGLLVGGAVKLVGVDAFALLVGQSPGDFTGGAEGLVLGGAIGLAAWLALRVSRWRRGVALACAIGGLAGLGIVLAGGHLLGGSLALLAGRFPESRLGLDALGALFGEAGFGPVSGAVTATLEGALFAAGMVGGMLFARGAKLANWQRLAR